MEVDDEVFDSEKLITEIEKRPTLYNKESPQYNNKDYKDKLWAEVYHAVVPNWNQLSKNGRTLKGDEIQKKWKNIRDYFRKQVQMNEKGKTVHFSRKRRKYIYFDQLLFLLPTIQGRDASSNYNLERADENDETEDYTMPTNNVENEILQTNETVTVPNPKPRKEKKEEMRPMRYEDILLEILKEKRVDEIDEDRNFLLSLVPSLKKLTDEQKFTVKSEFLNILKQQFLQSNVPHHNQQASHQLAQKQSNSFSQQLQLFRNDGVSLSAPPSPQSSCTPDMSNNDSNLLSPKSEPDFYDEL